MTKPPEYDHMPPGEPMGYALAGLACLCGACAALGFVLGAWLA